MYIENHYQKYVYIMTFEQDKNETNLTLLEEEEERK